MLYVHVTNNIVDGVVHAGDGVIISSSSDGQVYVVEDGTKVNTGYIVSVTDGIPTFTDPNAIVAPVGTP